ncbi:hypothetical protein GPECTOR_23g133 [Gonium pectorale]|uniref:Metallo-beta-lactamase domain-containing protein n=1 Tax=Gonium pectorale TaxID=33097 RepID=A0A150GGW5_GONPE|nr:hypothetical protein GPECTOR_23g133 [Gonium pectorale]|eukprot:KXZ49047.1 hypothetical protein GPECTOR_23g133 [Gonium pectorale]
MYRPSLSRQTSDPLPPLGSKATGLVQLGEALWCLRQDFWITENIYLNSHVIRLSSGSLLVISPPARTEEAEALLESLPGGCAAVEHVVLPNLSPEHWIHAAGWASKFASDATLWVVPGVLEGRSVAGLAGFPQQAAQLRSAFRRITSLPDSGPLPGLGGELAVSTFHEGWGLFSEAVLLLRDARAIVFSDMAFAIYDHPVSPLVGREVSKLVGIYRRLGAPLATPMMRKDPAAGRAWLETVLSWDFDTVLPGHLDPRVGPGGKDAVRECFGFLLH